MTNTRHETTNQDRSISQETFARGPFRLAVAALGILSCAAPAARAWADGLRSEAGPFELQVLVNGGPVRTFSHQGQSYALGQGGARYTLRVSNRSGRRVEAVVSVDGRDVIDGKPADVKKRGYLVPAWGSVDIDGWRLSERQAAAFRFASVADSYAAQMGNARNVGVIGVALFPERIVTPPPPVYRPYDNNRWYEPSARQEGAPAPQATADSVGDSRGFASREKSSAAGAPSAARSGLGTEFGERMHSETQEVQFVRAQFSQPSVLLGLRYNDQQGLVALGIDVDGIGTSDETALRQTANPFPVSYRRYATPPANWRHD